MATPNRQRRVGLTLLEVIVSTAIFLISVIAIAQLSNIGTERAVDVQLQTRTSLRCHGKLAEIVIGAETNASGGYTPFTDDFDKDLQWRAEVGLTEVAGLLLAKVWVKAELPSGKVVESQLSQMFVDPTIRGTTFDQPNPPPSPPTPPTP
ncbi:MAG: hypothetical protein EXR98_08625 [Gemmataceae bacterium]|nr:hypothetical protein [Gemmataceae bacterium]